MTHSRNHIHQRVEGQELYADDRDHNEWTNLAPIPNYSPLKSKLAKWLRKTCGQVLAVDGGLEDAFLR